MNNSSENIYADNKAIQKYNTYSRLSRFNYNDKNQVTEETSSNGLIKRYSYNEDNQIINETYEFKDKYIKTSNTYENGYVKTTKDNIQSITSYDINNITGITNSVTNSLNEIESYVHNNIDDITELRVSKNNDSKKTEYAYKTYKKVPVIDKVKLENGSVYEYVYDDYERVRGVDYYNINNVTNKKRLITYSYEDKNNLPNSNIKTINKFNSTYTKHYEYDNFNNITRIYYTDYMTGGALVTFTYDENKKLIKEVSGNNTYTKNYVYDSNNRLTETNDSNGVKFNYQYSKTNELNVKKQTIDNEVTYFDYDTLHQTRGSDSSAVIAEYETEEDIYTCFYNYFDEDNNRKIELVNFSNNGIKTAKEFVNNNFNVVTENGLSKIDYTQKIQGIN